MGRRGKGVAVWSINGLVWTRSPVLLKPRPLPQRPFLRKNMASSSAAPHENLWSSILNSVAQAPAGQRRKNLVVLGEPGAGRSVLVEGLARGGRASRASSLGAFHSSLALVRSTIEDDSELTYHSSLLGILRPFLSLVPFDMCALHRLPACSQADTSTSAAQAAAGPDRSRDGLHLVRRA